eukprot:ANDGO_01683.mRNA.1 hypothetical protein
MTHSHPSAVHPSSDNDVECGSDSGSVTAMGLRSPSNGKELKTSDKYLSDQNMMKRRKSSAFITMDARSDTEDEHARQSKLRALARRLFSIRLIFMTVVVIMIVAAGVSAWYLSWSNGMAAVEDITDKYRSSMLSRVQDRLQKKFTELRDLSTIDREYWFQHGYTLANSASMLQFTDSLWPSQLKIIRDSVPRSQSLYSHLTGWAVVLRATNTSASTFSWAIANPAAWSGKLAAFPYVPALPNKGRELPNITVVPWDPRSFSGVRDYIIAANPPPTLDVFMGQLEQTGVPNVLEFGLYQPASWMIRNSSGSSIGFGSKSISTNELQVFLQSISDISGTYSFISDRTDGLLVAANQGDVYYVGTSAGVPSYIRIRPSQSTVRQIQDGANELISRYGSLANVPSNTQFVLDSSEQYFVGATVFSFYEISWVVTVMIPRQAIMGRIDAANQNTLIVTICIVVAAVIIAVILTHFVAKPLDQLGHQMLEISQLRFPEESGARRTTFHEISQLQSSFDSMQRGIRAFSLYVPSNLVRQILKTQGSIGLGMDSADITVLFCVCRLSPLPALSLPLSPSLPLSLSFSLRLLLCFRSFSSSFPILI